MDEPLNKREFDDQGVEGVITTYSSRFIVIRLYRYQDTAMISPRTTSSAGFYPLGFENDSPSLDGEEEGGSASYCH